MAIEIVSSEELLRTSGVKILLYGQSGVGKSSQFKYTGKTLIISTEKGELALAGSNNDIDVARVSTMMEFKEAFKYAKDNTDKYDTIGIDSVSDISEIIVAHLKKDPEFASMKESFKLWMRYTEIMDAVAKSFRDLENVNVILIALEESVKNGFEEKKSPMISGKKTQSKLPQFYDEVLRLTIDEGGNRVFVTQPTADSEGKDRSGSLEPVESCTIKDGISTIINKINKKIKG